MLGCFAGFAEINPLALVIGWGSEKHGDSMLLLFLLLVVTGWAIVRYGWFVSALVFWFWLLIGMNSLLLL